MKAECRNDLLELFNTNDFKEVALFYNSNFGLRIIPVQITPDSKKPLQKWKEFQDRAQSKLDIDSMIWDHDINGIALVNDEKYISLDFDNCKDEIFIIKLVNELGINSWVVKTGRGFHIHLELEDPQNFYSQIGDKKSFYTLYPIDESLLGHLEIRIKHCYTVLPPSLHYLGTKYTYITGIPNAKPEKVNAQTLIKVISKHFTLSKLKNEPTKPDSKLHFNDLLKGVSQGQRHNALTKVFGIYYSQGVDKKMILETLLMWNKLNIPPIDERELRLQINDLWNRYARGLDNVFHQFQNCLLALKDPAELKLKKILCYSIVQFGSEARLIDKYKLTEVIQEYYNECSSFVKEFESKSESKDQIVRVGEQLIRNVIDKKIDYDLFSVYVGIISFLGRDNRPAKPISNDTIAFRALGYKTELDYLMSDCSRKPLSKYKIRKMVEKLEKMNLIRTFKLKRAVMTYYSTKIKSKGALAEYVCKIQNNKIQKKIDDEKLRRGKLEEILDANNKLKNIRNENKKLESTITYH